MHSGSRTPTGDSFLLRDIKVGKAPSSLLLPKEIAQRTEKKFERSIWDASAVHGLFSPTNIYQGYPIRVYIRSESLGLDGETECRAWRISPQGVDLELSPILGDSKLAKIDQDLSLRVVIDRQSCFFPNAKVASISSRFGKQLVGVSWGNSEPLIESSDQPFIERRKHQRWECCPNFSPTGKIEGKSFLRETLPFNVLNFSETSLLIACPSNRVCLIPGIEVDAKITFPGAGPLSVRLRLLRVDHAAKKPGLPVLIAAEFVSISENFRRAIGCYLFEFGPKQTSVKLLERSRFLVKRSTQSLEFGFVSDSRDFMEVLKLRFLAYSSAGKLTPSATIADVTDVHDSRARILVARHQGRIVGSLRMIFNSPSDTMELEEHLKVPSTFPKREECVEVTRLCTHPDFRSSDLFYGLMEHLLINSLQSGRKWVVASATPGLASVYAKLGGEKVKLTYNHRGYNGIEHHLILYNISKALTAKGINPLIWNTWFWELFSYVKKENLIEVGVLAKLRLSIYFLLKPVTGTLMKMFWRC